MTARDAIGLACVLWPSLRTPVALVDLAVGLAGRVRVDDDGQAWLGDSVTADFGVDWSSFGALVLVDTPHLDDPGAYPVLGLRLSLGPLHASVAYDPPQRADDGLRAWAEERWAA